MTQLTEQDRQTIAEKQKEIVAQQLHRHLQFLYGQAIREAENQLMCANEQIFHWETFSPESGKDASSKKAEMLGRWHDLKDFAEMKLERLKKYTYQNFLADPDRLFSRFYYNYQTVKNKMLKIDKN